MPTGRGKQSKAVETLTHDEARRRNLPSAEHQPLMREEEQRPVRVAYERRNRDLDPQLVWRGKDEEDLADLLVNAPPLYIQERVHPKALIDDLMRQSRNGHKPDEHQTDMFADFNGLPSEDAKTEFYQHDANWSNRMILGDSLQVMASLAEREGLRGKVQCIYIDPPYGIKFNSNFQWSTTSRDVRDGNREHITREPEQVKAFRDTWRDGIHSYLTYLRDRLTVARDLLADSGSIFVQIGDENVHRVSALMDEVFGEENFIVTIKFAKTAGLGGKYLDETFDYLLWYAKKREVTKFRRPYLIRIVGEAGARQYRFLMSDNGTYEEADTGSVPSENTRLFSHDNFTSQTASASTVFPFSLNGVTIAAPRKGGWKSNLAGVELLKKAGRVIRIGATPRYVRYFDDAPYYPVGSAWIDTAISGFAEDKVYVVQTLSKVIQRCILMTTDPGDLVLDPTCGSGTTAYVAEQWGRRWITIDTSRVALALARARVMGARYPYYLLSDSHEGQRKEAEVSHKAPSDTPTYGNVRQGFVYERVPHITLRDIANNAEIDVIYEEFQEKLEPLRMELNAALCRDYEEWEVPRESGDPWPESAASAWLITRGPVNTNADKAGALRVLNTELGRNYTLDDVPDQPRDPWDSGATDLHRRWWEQRIARQKKIDASIAGNAEYEYLYDKPYEDRGKVRVAGPFTVESISPHRVLGVNEDGNIIDGVAEPRAGYGGGYDFSQVILENLKTSGVQQAHREDRIEFTSITPWPGRLVCAEGVYIEGNEEDGIGRRAAIFIGPEFGTVSRPDLVEAAREAADGGFDVLIACAFNYEAHTTEFENLGRVPVLKARMNADLHMAENLKNTGKGNLFVIFGEPDIEVLDAGDGQIQVKVNGVDVFHPNTGEVRSDGPDGIACWFIDTDYNQEAFFVRHAYFLGASDPYKSLRTTLKAEIDADAWESLHSDTSRPFSKPESGRIAVKVINHLGDEVLKVFRVE